MRWTTGRGVLAVVAAMGGAAQARDVRFPGAISVTSPAFNNGGAIPRDYTCEGRSVSPPITWSVVPPETKSIVVIVDDPDAPRGTFEHFVAFNLPPTERSVPSESATATTPANGMTARNDSGTTGFAPICPPSGTHHYRFAVMALDTTLPRSIGGSSTEVANAISGHVLARGELVGTYQRSGR